MDDYRDYERHLAEVARKEAFVAGYKANGRPYYDYEIEEAWERYEQRRKQSDLGGQSGR